MEIKLTGTRLMVNGEPVDDGDRCDIDEAEATALIARGLAVPADGESEAQDGNADDVSDEERHTLIVGAIRDLIESDPEKGDESSWTKSGKPDVKALESLIGSPVSAAERDAAWQEVSTDSGDVE